LSWPVLSWRSAVCIAFCASGAVGCFSATLDRDALESKAAGPRTAVASLSADGGAASDAGSGYTVSLDTPPIELEGDDTTRDPCVATERQARAILERNCAGCHAPPAGMGGFRSILDFQALVNLTSSTLRDPVTGEPVRLVIPGDPAGSRLYRRAATGEMPPVRDATLPQLPRPSFSDLSVLEQWIDSCLPQVPAHAAFDAGLP
jgi:hypothetical protein